MTGFPKILLGLFLVVFGSLATAQNVDGVLKVVKGDVQIKSAKTGQMVKARIGEKVYPKDIVITGKDARAKIVMVDNNEINVSPESQIEIQHYEFDPKAGKKEVLLNVIYGKVRAKVEQKYDGKSSKFQVKTPAALAGVRGTDFMTSYNREDHSSQVVTFRGAVKFGLPGPGGTILNSVSVTPGKSARSVAGAAPAPPSIMPKSELAKMDKDTKAAEAQPTGNAPKSERTPSNENDKKPDGEKKPESGDKRDPASNGSNAKNEPGFDPAKDSAACRSCNPPPPIIDTTKAPAMPPRMSQPEHNCAVCNELIRKRHSKLIINVK